MVENKPITVCPDCEWVGDCQIRGALQNPTIRQQYLDIQENLPKPVRCTVLFPEASTPPQANLPSTTIVYDVQKPIPPKPEETTNAGQRLRSFVSRVIKRPQVPTPAPEPAISNLRITEIKISAPTNGAKQYQAEQIAELFAPKQLPPEPEPLKPPTPPAVESNKFGIRPFERKPLPRITENSKQTLSLDFSDPNIGADLESSLDPLECELALRRIKSKRQRAMAEEALLSRSSRSRNMAPEERKQWHGELREILDRYDSSGVENLMIIQLIKQIEELSGIERIHS